MIPNVDVTKFKSADELGISEEERDALIKVMYHLYSDDVPLTPRATLAVPMEQHIPAFGILRPVEATLGFCMSFTGQAVPREHFHCGAVACIGGHVSLLMQGVDVLSNGIVQITPDQARETMNYTESASGGLNALFYPPDTDVPARKWGLISAVSAAYATASYLTYGHPEWPAALAQGGQPELVYVADLDE